MRFTKNRGEGARYATGRNCSRERHGERDEDAKRERERSLGFLKGRRGSEGVCPGFDGH
jgi:hypothetical protein